MAASISFLQNYKSFSSISKKNKNPSKRGIFITIFWHSFFNLSRMAYQNNMHRGIYFYFIKTIFAIFLEKHYLHSWVGMKHAYLHQSLYRAIFKFVTNVIIWSNYYTTSIVFLFCLQNSTLKILNFFNKKIIEILEKTNNNTSVIFISMKLIQSIVDGSNSYPLLVICLGW